MSFHLSADSDPSALSRFGQLEVIARQVVEGAMIGQHKSPFKGSSVEFVEHRQYTTGDEIRHIDWRAYGKTGRYYVKEFEEETNLNAYLVVDCSASMAYCGSTASKFDYARVLAASLAYLLNSQRDSVGLVTFDNVLRDRVEPSTSMKNFSQISALLSAREPGGETSLSRVYEKLLPTLKKRSLLILVSDFFDDISALQASLQAFRKQRHEVVLLQVIAPEEESFPFETATQFVDLEHPDKKILVDPIRLRRDYLEQFNLFQSQLRETSARTGYDLVQIRTDQSFHEILGHYLDWRQRGGGVKSVAAPR